MSIYLQSKRWVSRLGLCLVLGSTAIQVWAHGGEDHGEQKVAVASANGATLTRVARAGDYEITLKQPNLEPDHETTARLFVTRYETNEAIAKANVALLIQAEGAPSAVVKESATPGLYEVTLPPLRAGTVSLTARLTVNGATETANFGAVTVAAPPTPAPADKTLWARTALLILGVLALVGTLGWWLWRLLRRTRTKQTVVAT